MEESDAKEVEDYGDYRTDNSKEVIWNDLIDRYASEYDTIAKDPCIPRHYGCKYDTCIRKHPCKDCPVDIHIIADILECDCRDRDRWILASSHCHENRGDSRTEDNRFRRFQLLRESSDKNRQDA